MTIIEITHSINLVVHISAGSVALLLGIVALLTRKGGTTHRKIGNTFLFLLTFVIITGLIGVFIFGRNTFLLIITLLSAYYGFSGYRILQLKSNNPKPIDIVAPVICLLALAYFLYYFKGIGMIWSPVIIYSTVGTLISIIGYDFIRYFIPAKKYQRMWMYEHIYKMIGAFTALLAAFTGTVFESYQPYSQIMPSVLGVLLQIGFIAYFYKKNNQLRNFPRQAEYAQ